MFVYCLLSTIGLIFDVNNIFEETGCYRMFCYSITVSLKCMVSTVGESTLNKLQKILVLLLWSIYSDGA